MKTTIKIILLAVAAFVLFAIGQQFNPHAVGAEQPFEWKDPMKAHCAEFAQAVEKEAGIPISWDINPEGRCRLHPVQR